MFMIMRFVRVLSLVTIASLFIVNLSWAYTIRTTNVGNAIRWQQDRVTICLDESLSEIGDLKEVGDIVAEAFATWEGSGAIPTTFDVVECGPSKSGNDDPYDGRNEVTAVDGRWPYESHSNAVTLVTYDSNTGVILDADIVFHADVRWSLGDGPAEDAYDVLDTATHEVGHLVGLGHSERPRATMFEVTTPGSVARRTLHDDDIAGVADLYGAMPLGRYEGSGCSVISRGGRHEGTWLLFGIFLYIACFRRRAKLMS